jgi:hypothetical protein
MTQDQVGNRPVVCQNLRKQKASEKITSSCFRLHNRVRLFELSCGDKEHRFSNHQDDMLNFWRLLRTDISHKRGFG